MSNVILSLVSPEGTVRVDFIEGENSGDMLQKVEQALTEHPLIPKLGRGSVKDMIYGRKTTVSGWHVEKDGKNLADGSKSVPNSIPVTVIGAVADGTVATTPDAGKEATKPADTLPSSPEASTVKHAAKKTRKPRTAKTTAAPAAVKTGRREKVYKLGPKVAEMTSRGMIAKIVELVKQGKNTKSQIIAALPGMNKSTIQHEICMAGPAFRNYIAIDEEATAKAAQESQTV